MTQWQEIWYVCTSLIYKGCQYSKTKLNTSECCHMSQNVMKKSQIFKLPLISFSVQYTWHLVNIFIFHIQSFYSSIIFLHKHHQKWENANFIKYYHVWYFFQIIDRSMIFSLKHSSFKSKTWILIFQSDYVAITPSN